jgi:dipeptidyl aminopeptidase/acylaminoacyl peptidase
MTRFDDLRDYVAIPRLNALRLAPDGSWLAAAVQTLGKDGNKFVTSIWRIDPDGGAPARLTRSAEGESGPEFLPDGSLLFISKRPEPATAADRAAAGPESGDRDGSDRDGSDRDGSGEDDAEEGGDREGGDRGNRGGGKGAADAAGNKPALWLLPAAGGEARRIATPPGGIAGVAVARHDGSLVFASPMLGGSTGIADDVKRRKARKDTGVTAILHEAGPVRYWDHDLGPDGLRLLSAELRAAQADGAGALDGLAEPELTEARDLTPDAGRALDDQTFELTPDGSVAVTGWLSWDEVGDPKGEAMLVTVATGERRALLSEPDRDFLGPRISPDGRLVACFAENRATYESPGDVTLVVAAVDGSDKPRDLLAGLDRYPAELAWAPDSGSVYFTADDQGRRPVLRADLDTGEITRVTTDDGAYGSLCPAPDGRTLYALRTAIDEPPTPVRIDVTAPGSPQRLKAPGLPLQLPPGRVAEVTAAADDGTPIRGWLVLPDAASADSPAPFLLWVHGGPESSWNGWSWRWNPWLMVARGYAVLLPDPALSTGYGHDFIARGHGAWGGRPYTDVMAITDAVVARPDIDAGRTGMMGGSFGGYMANWIAGHTDRFRAIVAHASLWALDEFMGTTDEPGWWRRSWDEPLRRPERYQANSPHLHVDNVSTPMLIIHGDRDYRVPVGEALRVWWDLRGRGKDAKFLYFPDENHWILTPGNIRVWYQTVFAFLAHYVLTEPWVRPDLL